MRVFLALIFFSFFGLSCQADPLKILEYQLDTNVKFSEPTKLNESAVSLTSPSNATYAEAQIELIVHRYNAETVKGMTEAEVPLGKSVQTNILGLSIPPTQINKTLFMGGTSARKVYESRVPRIHRVHVFQRMAPNGSFVTVAVRVFQQNRATGPLLQSIANTFKLSKQ